MEGIPEDMFDAPKCVEHLQQVDFVEKKLPKSDD
jgi:hypothetical protein